MTAGSSTQADAFQGKYVHDIVHVLIASAVSGQHCTLLSGPGYGKTRIARTLSQLIAGESAIFTRLEGSTPPEVVKGAIDPAAALESPPRIVYVTKGTPYDPSARIVVADEIFRPSDVVFDAMLDVLDRQDVNPDTAPVVWGTSNFVVRSERVEAILDRIALWHWVRPDVVPMTTFVTAVANRRRGESLTVPTNGIPIPTLQDIETVRGYVPNQDTIKLVATKLIELESEANSGGFKTNPRRRTQWFEILYRMSAYLRQGADFETIPPLAAQSLRWAWPTLSAEEWVKWSEVAVSVSDPVGAAVDALYSEALKAMNEIKGNTDDPQDERAIALGVVLARAQRSLEEFGRDPRAQKAVEDLTDKFTRLAQDLQSGAF